ncbi:MAG: hypothetical protein C0597_16275 [Marinilabiliales bacterium]|nr:MAG: hypothetical protein C0597_16275 [Marinilabiliales bacterium]
MKLILISILFVLFLSQSAFSQVFPLLPKYYQPLDSSVLGKDDQEQQEKNETLIKRHEKVSYSVALGTGYTSFGNDLSMLNSYIAPTIDYQVNSKLNFSVTGIIMQNNFNGMEGFYGNEPGYSYNSNPSNYGITGSAYYQLNDKWSIWGDGAYMENQSIFNDYRSEVYDNDYKTMSIGVGYKLNDKFHFNFQYRYSNGLHPAYNYNPAFNTGLHNRYGNGFGYWYY